MQSVIQAKMNLFDHITTHHSLSQWSEYLEYTNKYLRGHIEMSEYKEFVSGLLGDAGLLCLFV